MVGVLFEGNPVQINVVVFLLNNHQIVNACGNTIQLGGNDLPIGTVANFNPRKQRAIHLVQADFNAPSRRSNGADIHRVKSIFPEINVVKPSPGVDSIQRDFPPCKFIRRVQERNRDSFAADGAVAGNWNLAFRINNPDTAQGWNDFFDGSILVEVTYNPPGSNGSCQSPGTNPCRDKTGTTALCIQQWIDEPVQQPLAASSRMTPACL